jgi:hypothetical protein
MSVNKYLYWLVYTWVSKHFDFNFNLNFNCRFFSFFYMIDVNAYELMTRVVGIVQDHLISNAVLRLL